MAVIVEIKNDVLILKIDNSPVNALSAPVRIGINDAINRLKDDKSLIGALITGSQKAFSGGADIKEFGKKPISPVLPDLLVKIEQCEKPIVAAIDGVALGGGLELALACRARVATSRASMGLPEVNLGIIPGAGGTQRLPRLIGGKGAAEIITSGKPISAQKALELGLVERLVEGDIVEAARELACNIAQVRQSKKTDRQMEKVDVEWFKSFEEKLKQRSRGQLSPLKGLEAVKASQVMSLEDGLKYEREIFLECMESDQRAALMHTFFIERQAKKPAFLEAVSPRRVNVIGVLGAGTMGAGIAIAAVKAGYRVKIFDANAEALGSGVDRIKNTFRKDFERGRLSSETVEALNANVLPVASMNELSEADLFIEAIVENMEIKKKVFGELAEIAKPNAVLASNTSYLDINEIASATSRPSDVIGMHFFSPANIMRLLEIVRTDVGSLEALATANAVAQKMKKIPVFAGVCDGFIGNRMFKKYRQQAEYLVEEGASPQDVDRVMRAFGFAMGPFEVSDLAGLDIGWATRRREDESRDPKERYVDIADHLYDMGRLGQKTGEGWYKYQSGDRTPIVDPIVEKLIADRSASKGIKRRKISDNEISNKILFSMINEGAKILDEEIAASASDIDLVFLHGYGFPKHRGGPMFYAERYGLAAILEAIEGYAKQDPYHWRPAELLVHSIVSEK